MAEPISGFTLDTTQEIARILDNGWILSKEGLLTPEIPGFGKAAFTFNYAGDPNAVVEGNLALAAMRATPVSQRDAHLEAQVTTLNGKNKPLFQFIQDNLARFGITGLSALNFPMQDCTLIMPTPADSENPIYFDGEITNSDRHGAAMIVKGGKDEATWVTNSTTGNYSMPIAPAQFGIKHVFTANEVLGKITRETVGENAITAIILASNELVKFDPELFQQLFIEQFSWLFQKKQSSPLSDFRITERGGDRMFGQSLDFLKLGENAVTNQRTSRGSINPEMRHGLILNIFPMSIRPSLEQRDIKLLEQLNQG